MDAKRIAGEFGRTLAMGTVAHSLQVEADVTRSHISPYPVRLEPPFRPFDPGQTFEPAREPSVAQAPRVEERITRRVILPLSEDLEWKTAEAMLAGLAGLHAPMSFELLAQHERASFYLSAPAHAISFLTATAVASYPDSAIIDTTDPWLAINPAALVLYDLYVRTPYHRAIRASGSPWPQLFQLCPHLRGEEIVFCQILFAPVREAWQQNIVGMLEAERSLGHRAPQGRTATPKNLAEPLFAVAVRLGTTTTALAGSIAAITGIFTVDGEPFGYRTLDDFLRVLSFGDVLQMLRCRQTHTTGQLLTSSELARFVHLPNVAAAGSVRLSFLSGLPVPEALQSRGIPLGLNTSRGVPVPVFQPEYQHNRSCWLIGASRMGKSSALVHRCRFLAQQGHGIGLIDPHRSTCFDLLSALGEIDPDRVVFLDFDAPIPVAYNPFDHPDEENYGRLTTDYVHSLKHLFDAAGFYRMAHLLGMGIYALFVLKRNLVTLPALFAKNPAGEHLRRQVIASVKNAEVRRFWEDEVHTYSTTAIAPILNRLSALLLDDRTHRTFAQHQNRVDIAAAMDTGKILIVAPPASIDAAGIVGGILIAQAKLAAFRRSGTARAASHFHLTVDEFHRFITSAKTLQSIIDEAAKGGLSVSLANQETGQIPSELLKAMYSIPNIFVFGVNLPDAKQLAQLFNGNVTPETLAAQTTGDVHARIGQDIVNFHAPPPFANASPANAARIIAASRAHYHAPPQTEEILPRRQARIIDTFLEES